MVKVRFVPKSSRVNGLGVGEVVVGLGGPAGEVLGGDAEGVGDDHAYGVEETLEEGVLHNLGEVRGVWLGWVDHDVVD